MAFCGSCCFLSSVLSYPVSEFLPENEVFIPSLKVMDKENLLVEFDIKEGYYLYKQELSFESLDPNLVFGDIKFPQAQRKFDLNFNQRVELYNSNLFIHIPMSVSGDTYNIKINYQGCSYKGLCYPPISKVFVGSILKNDLNNNKNIIPIAKNNIFDLLSKNSYWYSLFIIFLIGIGLSMTPCVFPMLPILSSIIIGEHISRKKSLQLSLVYILSMSIVYALLGTLMGLFGASMNLQAKLHIPWLVAIFSLFFLLFGLSMLGIFEIHLPNVIKSKFQNIKGVNGTFPGAAIMGGASSLIVSPCVSAPLASILIYISVTENAYVGASSLFLLSLGMGIPLLIISVCGHNWLPKSGKWMLFVKSIFGYLMIGIAIWILQRILSTKYTTILWSVYIISFSLYLFFLKVIYEYRVDFLLKVFGFVFFIYGVFLFIGTYQGNLNHIKPLYFSEIKKKSNILKSSTVKSYDELNIYLNQANKIGAYVVVELYADWCVSCKLMEKKVIHLTSKLLNEGKLKDLIFIRFDVTKNTEEQQKWMQNHKLFGPPSLLFYDGFGNLIPELSFMGDIDEDVLERKLLYLNS